MRYIVAVALSALLPFLGLNGIGPAQAQTGVEIQGTLEAVDCNQGTVTVDTSQGQTTFIVDANTAAYVDSTNVEFCSLEGYIGAPVTVWLVAYGGEFLATQIEVTGPPAVAPYTMEAINPLPIWGTVLGTILVAGLLYLLVHEPDNHYYRYPYYGAYYRHYYHRGYRAYQGYYPESAPIVTVAWPISGVVLGTVEVNNYEYIMARDSGGHFYRYPYYGPYRQYYYRPTYRPYTGAYVNVVNVHNNVHVTNVVHVNNIQVRQGDPHWDAPAAYASSHANYFRSTPQRQPFNRPSPQPAPQRPEPTYQPAPQRQPYQPPQRQPDPVYQPAPQRQPYQPPQRRPQPTYQVPQRQPDPVYQPAPQRQPQPTYQPPQRQPQPVYQPTYQPPQRQPQPAYQPPPRQPQPVYQPPQRQPQPAYQSGRGNPHESSPADQCGGRQSNQSCSSDGASKR